MSNEERRGAGAAGEAGFAGGFPAAPVLVYLLILAVSPDLAALTFVPPVNFGELARESEAVVLAEAGDSWAVARGAYLFTRSRVTVLWSLSAGIEPGSELELEVPGGTLEGRFWIVPGSPSFRSGGRYLLCLSRKAGDLYTPRMLAYGVLEEIGSRTGELLLAPLPAIDSGLDHPGALPRPDGVSAEPLAPYREAELLAHLGAVVRGAQAWDATSVMAGPFELPPPPGGGAVPAGCAFIAAGAQNVRWQAFDSGGTATIFADATGDQSLAGGGFQQVAAALDTWMNVTGTGVNLVFGGSQKRAISCSVEDIHPDAITFNDPCSDMPDLSNCGGVLAFGGPLGGTTTHRFDNATWATATSWGVVVNNGSGCIGPENYRIMLAHELGHGLGFAHIQDPTAMMFASCCNNVNATDITCLRYVYPPPDPQNRRPLADAGGSRSLTLARNVARFAGKVSDDGLPAVPGQLTTSWTGLAGPGTVTFSDPSSLETSAGFEKPGAYLVGLSAWDGRLFRLSVAVVTVNPWASGLGEAVFQQGIGGFQGTVDTALVENVPAADSSRATELSVDSDDPSGSGKTSEVLLRFTDVFGVGAGQVPPGAPIRFAQLDLATTNPGAGATLHRMKDAWGDRDSWSTFGGNGIQSGTECFSEVDSSAVGVGGVVAVDVTRSLALWSEDPCQNQGWVLLPAGTDGWDFSSAEGGQPPHLTVQYASLEERKLIALGDSWSYFKGTAAPPADWVQPEFTAGAGWGSGPTGIGYGDADDATNLSDMRTRYFTVFCRREFTLADPADLGRLELLIDYDDGFVAYLNGEEAARSASMGPPGSAVDRGTPAASHEAGGYESYLFDASLLRQGRNVLAVEVHNDRIDSSDLSFRPELKGSRVLIDEGAEWKFLRGSATLPANWMAEDFDDLSWETGPSGIGYGGGDDGTVLADMQGKYLTVFCRKTFELNGPAASPGLALAVVYDDGVVAYLNGKEIGRANVPAGVPGRSTPALQAIDAQVATFAIPPNLLHAGTNVLAVSVHNRDLGSSDLTFVPVLFPPGDDPRPVTCGSAPTFRRGDPSGEGEIDISDPIFILDFLFLGGTAPVCLDAADIDDDGALSLTDGIRLLNYLFLSDAPPPPPGPNCGEDPTADPLEECGESCGN